MTLLNRITTHDNSAPMSKMNTCATAEALIDVLGQHSDRDRLLILMDQVFETQAEIRIL